MRTVDFLERPSRESQHRLEGWAACGRPLTQKSLQSLLHCLVPQSVNERVERGCDYCVEDRWDTSSCPAGARLQVDADGRYVVQTHHREVGSAGGEGTPSALGAADSQHRHGDEAVGKDDEDQASYCHDTDAGKHGKLIDGCVCTGQLHHSWDVTEEVSNMIRATVEQPEGEGGMGGRVHST